MRLAVITAFLAVTHDVLVQAGDPPASAADDLAKDAAVKAAAELTAFHKLQAADRKTDAKYDAGDAAAKKALDDQWVKDDAARDKRDADERTAAGYASMTTEQKTIFDAEVLKYKKAKHTACRADAKALACTGADAVRVAEEKKRNTEKYYAKKTTERETFDKAQADESKKLRASMQAASDAKAAALLVPKVGEVGFDCKKDAAGKRPACALLQCCGTAKKTGALTGIDICNLKTATKYADKKSVAYTFACGAKHLVASTAALLAAASLIF